VPGVSRPDRPQPEVSTFDHPFWSGGVVHAASQENQVEWIFERPGVTGASQQLPDYGEIYFDSALGGYGLVACTGG
jgi:hypothetical protein